MTFQLFINDVEIDVSKKILFPLTFRISDVKEPNKRKRNKSTTIVLPGTKNNNKFFQSAYDLNISDVRGDSLGFEFDSTLRYPCRVTRNGSEIFRGTANLQDVDQIDGVNNFNVILYSEITNLFQALGDITVAELGWSEYDEILNITNIEDSWTNPVGSGIWWPLVDYGFTANTLEYKTNELRPHVYAAEVVEKCFEKAGLTMSSTFFDSALIQKMAWGYGGGEQISLNPTEVNNRRAKYSGDGSVTYNFPVLGQLITPPSTFTNQYPYFKTIPFSDNNVVTMNLTQDNNSQFNQATGEFVVFNDGDYKLDAVCTTDLTYAFSAPPGGNTQTFVFTQRLRIFKNQALIVEQVETHLDSAAGNVVTNFALNQEFQMNAGDIITVDFQLFTSSQTTGQADNSTLDVTLDFNNTIDLDLQAINNELIDGDLVEVAQFLPKMKAKDFLQDMITMFNLYMGDPDEDNVVVFEPIDDFYFETDDVDQWSKKVDKSKKINIKPAANIQGKVYKFKWATDRDYYKQLYAETYGTDYGDLDYEVPSTFKTGEKKYELKMAQSVPVQIEGTNIIIPRIIKVDEGTLVSSPHKGKPRIYFNNGLRASDPWDLINSDTLVATTFNSYPVAHHLDDIDSPTFDLNFGVPQWVYYAATAYITNNMFQKYHLQFIRELTARDSKIVNLFARLTEEDLYKGFMRRLCNIDGVLYRKNIIKEFRSTSNDSTKVELVKILTGNSRGTYTVPAPPGFEPPMSYGGDKSLITGDTKVRSERKFYPFDTSGGNIAVELPADDLRPGWEGSFKKTTAPGKLIFTPTGGGATGSSIDGATSAEVTGKNDGVTIYFDGQNFYIT